MTTFAQMQAQGVAFLKAQVGKGYTEVLGQNLGPDKWDCEGLARAVYLPFGVDIGFGSRAQFENSKVQLKPSDPWLVLDQVFFNGSDPPFGHTGVYVGPVVPGGAYTMISALDTASGVCYSEINPTIGGPGFSITGRTRPLSLVVPAPPPPPAGIGGRGSSPRPRSGSSRPTARARAATTRRGSPSTPSWRCSR